MLYSDFEAKLLPCKNKNILLGFSGGADSCALFLILQYWRTKIPFTLTAVHFEHGIRGKSSLNDAKFCRKVAEKYNVPFRTYPLDVPQNMLKNETVESAARRLRLAKWHELSTEFENCEIHLAHHADDLTENIFLRLFRGANVSGLCGLREFSTLNNMKIRRILLNHSRNDIEEFLRSADFQKYCTDESNFDCNIGRNYLRNKLLKDIAAKFPYAPKGIIQSAEVCESDADFIEKCAFAEFEKIKGSEFVSNDFYKSLHPALLIRVLRLYFSTELRYECIPDKNFSQRFSAALQQPNNTSEYKVDLDENNFYMRHNDMWQIIPKKSVHLAPIVWDYRQTPEIICGEYLYKSEIVDGFIPDDGNFYFDLSAVGNPLTISSRRIGETFEKFGGGHSSVKDELINRKIPLHCRDKICILRSQNNEIMLIGDFRRTSFAKINGKNQKILKIRVEKSEKWCIL